MTQHTEETPVLLLTGFLGSGKTTLLNRILSNQKGIRFAVIVNDLGEINIDAALIQQGGVVGGEDDSLVALQNGCICCTLKINLVEQLSDLIATHRFDYIVIEASGICEPEPIAQTICSIPYMENKYREHGVPKLDCIVTVVDALRIRNEYLDNLRSEEAYDNPDDLKNLIIQQIEFCNLILLNKAAEVAPTDLDRIRALLRALQPKADIIPCNYGDVPMERLLHTGLFDFEKTATSATWIRVMENIPDEEEHDQEGDDEDPHHEHEHEHEHEHHHHHHSEEGEADEYGIGTFVYQTHTPMHIGRFERFASKYLETHVIRSKGLCHFQEDPDNCYLFDQVGSQLRLQESGQWYATMPPEELEPFLQQHPEVLADWDETYGDRMQKLVFIGQHLDTRELRTLLDQCLVS
jgi:G3E family GTPase